MDVPKAPNDAKNWESMDIYLFSNGQQSSPPRKYHLRYDELKLWDATICFLAHSHYGSMQSNIELYTLDGKIIGSPLELKNDMAYVAVKPPETFIPAGYKKYLIKASRSWEKRQEELLSNSCANSTTGHHKCTQDCTKECINALNLNKDVIENLCPNCETSMVLKESNNLPESVRHMQECKEIKKCDINRNNSKYFKSNTKEQLFKRKDTAMINKTEVNNHLRQLATPNNSISHHVNKNRQCKGKAMQKTATNNRKHSKINTEIGVGKISNGIVSAFNKEDFKDDTKYQNNNNSSKPVIVSNMIKNPDSDTQSFLIDVNQNLLDLENRCKNIPEYNSINNHKNDNTTHLFGGKNKEQNTDFDDKEIKVNICLNINLKDYTNVEKSFINRCNSELRVLTDRTSQLNIDVILSKVERNFKNNVSQIKNPPECDANNNEGITHTINRYKDIMVMSCECYNKNNILTERYAKEHSNCLLMLPVVDYEKCSDTKEMVDKETQVSSDPNCEEIGDTIPTQCTVQSNFDEKFNIGKELQNREKRKNAPTIISLSHRDMFTQTDWCNVLLQTIRHEDGHYTFRLPTLALLKQYNINNNL